MAYKILHDVLDLHLLFNIFLHLVELVGVHYFEFVHRAVEGSVVKLGLLPVNMVHYIEELHNEPAMGHNHYSHFALAIRRVQVV